MTGANNDKPVDLALGNWFAVSIHDLDSRDAYP